MGPARKTPWPDPGSAAKRESVVLLSYQPWSGCLQLDEPPRSVSDRGFLLGISMKNVRPDLRNIALIAHLDHVKTTLGDTLVKHAHTFPDNQRCPERVLDSN